MTTKPPRAPPRPNIPKLAKTKAGPPPLPDDASVDVYVGWTEPPPAVEALDRLIGLRAALTNALSVTDALIEEAKMAKP